MSEAAATPSWRDRAERGTLFGIRAVLWFATAFGRSIARAIVALVALYYTLISSTARRAIRQFHDRMGRPVGYGQTYRHILRFAQVTLDALFFAVGKVRRMDIVRNGNEHLAKLRRDKQGAILLGAHLGSFYAMRSKGDDESLPLYAVVYTKHAARINQVLKELDPTSQTRLLQMGEGFDFTLKIRELIEGGNLVAMLADRVGDETRSVSVEFFGRPARFPSGPFILAATLKCPVYLTFGLHRPPRRYELFCEPFATRIELPRASRQQALQEVVARYAARLEHYCRMAPDNWFNFYDFWAGAES